MERPGLTLGLSRAEVIVFVDFLMRYRDKDRLAIEHEAEQCLLYDLCSMIETKLPELFDPGWRALVEKARDEVAAGPSIEDR